ncbi:hypothetical protein ACET3Z_028993 [Daucus carota]
MSAYDALNDQLSGLDIEEEENAEFTIEGEVEEEGNRGKEEVDKEWGSWLRAPPRRSSAPAKSKWLREDGDIDWEERRGRVNVNARSGEGSWRFPGNQGRYDKDATNQVQYGSNGSYRVNEGGKDADLLGGKNNSNFNNGPEEEELIGLQVTERKRMRGDPDTYAIMDTEGGLAKESGGKGMENRNPDVVLSEIDCSTSSNSNLAKLARQASQQP